MSFLFGKKDKKQAPPSRNPTEAQSAVGTGTSIPTLNGARPKERGQGVISPPPGTSLNNTSVHAVEDGNTPSPENMQSQRGRLDSDLQVCLNW